MAIYKKSAVVKTMQCIVSTKNVVSTKRADKKAFTLVELIIVITILAILATIAFISFQGYNKNARDGNRLATVRNIEKGLELYQLKTTFYPIPENITGTGVIGGDTVNFVGVVGEEISKVIGIGKGPKDPSSDNYYLYGLSENKRKYQIGITLEKLESSIISKTAYADTYYAKVLGNYTYPLKLNSKLYSMPSLLFVGPSITDLATFTGFVVDKGVNLPYNLNGNTENTKDITSLLQEITGTSATLSLTGVDISSYSSNLALKGTDTTTIETALGIKKDLVGQAVFGKSYYSNDLVTNTTSSGTTTPPPATTTVNATCGSSNGTTVATIPTTNLCGNGTTPSVSGTGPWNWTCVGTGTPKGSDINCSANKITTVNATCGSSNGTTVATIPTTNLCGDGTTPSVSGTGPWNWTCVGTGTPKGNDITCNASKTIANSCSTTLPTNATTTIGTPTSVNQAWQNTNSSNPCYFSCNAGYSGANCEIPLTGWRAVDPNCDINDIIVGTQTWAGCNSTLGTGIEYNVDQNCYNYAGGSTTGCNRPSNEKENVYNAVGVNNIWGKLYVRSEASKTNGTGPCRNGYHLPTETEWATLAQKSHQQI